ncbi:hypothetical protein CRE_10528 [Caenorhabditis remanei]|uniref:F-box domain-containing protein n=1 Tax=Caenorhabditis remanei TaxID=31234 RepID=E3N0R1_CAERE|nr:hypothetical protein CRE_10528 [Caenorhabditis remanei]
MRTPFPLLCLPRLALIPVFQQMEFIDAIAFSFISKKTCNLSKILCKKISSCYIDMLIENDCLRMTIAPTNGSPLSLYFYTDVSKTVEGIYRYKIIQWKNAGLSIRQWMERLLDVTKFPSLRKVKLNGTPDYDVFSILDIVPKVSDLHISRNCTNTLAKRALQILSPVTSSITLFKLPFSNREEFQRFWLRDVECLSVSNDNLSRFQFDIDHLLASNAIKLELLEVSMSLRDLNRFFSCWLNKTSNQRLEHLSVQSLGDFDEDILLNGLNATRFTENRTREFLSTNTFSQFRLFTGGFDVRRKDGKLAAITFAKTFWTTYINFHVLP